MPLFRRSLRHPLAQAGTMGALALALAILANLAAGPERRVPWGGYAPSGSVMPAPVLASAPEPPLTPPNPQPPPPSSALAQPTPPTTAPPPAPSSAQGPTVPGRPSPDPEALGARFPLDPSNPIRDLDEVEAWEAWRLGALFVDARRSAEFRAGHIQGARSLPLWEDGLEARLADLRDFQVEDPRRVIVLYCTGSACTDSHDLAQRLFALGLPNLRIYTGGYPAWARHGRPVAKGAQP